MGYWLTVGGFGLTGHIVSVDIALQPLVNKIVHLERHHVSNLQDAAKLLEEYTGNVDYSYSWHDLNQSGIKFGEGTIYLERYISSDKHTIRNIQQPIKEIYQPIIYPLF